MNLPSLALVIVTYNRPEEIRRTVLALKENLTYDGTIVWYVADDCSPGDYALQVRGWMQDLLMQHVRLVQPSQNSGWGANVNYTLRASKEPIVFQIEDDYVLRKPIDLTPYVAMLLQSNDIGLIRFDGIAGHHVHAEASEIDIRPILPNYQQCPMCNPGKVHYWRLNAHSRELYIYSNRPHLKHRRFHDRHGKYPEGLKLGQTEESFAHRVKNNMMRDPDTTPQIVVPMGYELLNFDHIGISHQHTEFDK